MDIRYHTCGVSFPITWEWNGLTHYPVRLDDTGEEADWTCPGCGEYIYRHELLVTPPAPPLPLLIVPQS